MTSTAAGTAVTVVDLDRLTVSVPLPARAPNRLAALAAAGGTAAICLLIVWHISYKATQVPHRDLTIVYTVVVGAYIVSRFALSAVYRPPADRGGALPSVALIVPAFNESATVVRTIDACTALDYPLDRIEIVAVDDGSTDDTFHQMRAAADRYAPGRVRCLTLGANRGKRAAMAAGIRATTADVLVFVDSDSHPDRDAVRLLVQAFADERVGAVSGISFVRNARHNGLTRMQSARYFVSFQLLKAAESTLGAVSCCSGCFSAYRRSAVTPLLEDWESQRFLGRPCTYGDDRALTNRVLRSGWRSVYDCRAQAWTDAPTRYRTFFRQQLRWKKSWTREGFLLLTHLWRTRPLAFPFVLVATMAGLLSPFVMAANLARPLVAGQWPLLYVLGLYLVAMAYGLFHRALRDDRMWPFAVLGTFFYLAGSLQLVWAIARLRDTSWGTRAAGTRPTPAAVPATVAIDLTAPGTEPLAVLLPQEAEETLTVIDLRDPRR